MASRKRTLLPIGVHIGTDAVHMAQLDQGEGSLQMVSKASRTFAAVGAPVAVPVGADGLGDEADGGAPTLGSAHYEESIEFVRQKIATDGFRGADTVVSLPSEHLTIQHLRLPPVPPEEMVAALPTELEGKLPYDPKDAVVRHIVAGMVTENNETKQDVIVLAAQRSVIEDHVTAMTKIGLHVIGVGAEPCAMCYAYMYAAGHTPATHDGPPSLMVVSIGSRLTQVAIMRGPDTTFVKHVAHGSDDLLTAMAKARSVSTTEAAALRKKWMESARTEDYQQATEAYRGLRGGLDHFVDEIESCMRYHASLARGTRVDRVYFVGPQARDAALVKVLSGQLGVACEVGDPVGVVAGVKAGARPEPELAVAIGLSLFSAQ
jgi:type IV pilus assembly protein PilM